MHTIKYLGPILFSAVLYSNAQAQENLSATLSTAERMKKIMHENYEPSHASNTNTDSISNQLNGQQIIRDQHGKIIKEGEFRNGILRDGFFYKYSDTGNFLEKHIYKNGKYLTKVMP